MAASVCLLVAAGGWALHRAAAGQQGLSVPPSAVDLSQYPTRAEMAAAIDATGGTVSWTFPTIFLNSPTCWETLTSSATNYSFDAPIVTSIGKTAVTIKVTAHPSALSITSLALPVALPLTVNPPAGTTVTLSCVGALP